MEGGVETRDLRQLWKGFAKGAHAFEVVRLVQRRQRVQARQLLQHVIIDDHAGAKSLTAMHDPVRHGLDGRNIRPGDQQFAQFQQGFMEGVVVRNGQGAAMRLAFERPAHLGRAAGLQPLNAAVQHTGLRQAGLQRMQRELER